jgi:hypothetical protein
MIRGRRSSFEARCRERGYDLAAAWACVVDDQGDIITVDETHAAYPKAPPGQEPPPRPLAVERTPVLARDADTPSWLQKAKNFAVAAAQHVAAGMPTCTDDEIIRRHDICMACEFFKDSACTKCGCPVKRDRQYISKLAWADQSCPVGKWGPVNG